MNRTNDYLMLKWQTLKEYDFTNSPDAFDTLIKFRENTSYKGKEKSVEQKELICTMIDQIQGDVLNAWTGKPFDSKEKAKKYVMDGDVDLGVDFDALASYVLTPSDYD